jgi:hypothetical protein
MAPEHVADTRRMYLIEPTMPEFSERMPQLHTPRRYLVRFIVHQLLASSLGYIRLTQRMRSWQGPTSLVEQRAEAVLARRPHYWAQAQEWYALPESWRQTLDAQIPPALPLEVAISKQFLKTKPLRRWPHCMPSWSRAPAAASSLSWKKSSITGGYCNRARCSIA